MREGSCGVLSPLARPLMLVVVAALVACRHRDRGHRARVVDAGAEVAVVAAPGSAAPSASAPAPAVDVCAPLRAEHEAALAKAKAAAKSLNTKLLPAALGFCAPSGKGAWGLLLAHARPDPGQWVGSPESVGEGVRGRIHLVHRGLDGASVRIAPVAAHLGARNDVAIGFDSFETGDLHRFAIDPPVVFDFDGDGIEEIVLILRDDVYEEGTWSRGRVWSLRDGKIVLYPPAKEIDVEAVRDVDGDGRPDLLTYAPFVASVPPQGWSGHGPPLVAHSLPDGTFSRDDEVVVDAARAECAKPPRPNDPEAPLVQAACARLSGKPGPKIEVGDPCDVGCTVRDFAKLTPPFSIR